MYCVKQDVRGVDKPFGGVAFVCAGDYRQILPVKKHASREQIVASSVQQSKLWRQVETIVIFSTAIHIQTTMTYFR